MFKLKISSLLVYKVFKKPKYLRKALTFCSAAHKSLPGILLSDNGRLPLVETCQLDDIVLVATSRRILKHGDRLEVGTLLKSTTNNGVG